MDGFDGNPSGEGANVGEEGAEEKKEAVGTKRFGHRKDLRPCLNGSSLGAKPL